MSAREQYLEALGVDVWKSRTPVSAAATPAAVAQAVVAQAVVAQAAAAPAVAAPAPSALAANPPAISLETKEAEPVWQALQEEVRACRRCGLCETRTQTVFGVGDRRAEILVIGEAPGQDEDEQGEPFVGRAGQLLNSMLRAMGNPRETVYIANILKCRPPGNRNPNPTEVSSCISYLERQIDLIQPRLILAVGGIAAKNLLSSDAPVGQLRGQVHRFGRRRTPLIVTYHPAYLLRSPGEKRKVWTDLKFVRAELVRARSQ
jgi:uracil-DNA glycosylase family 4